MKKSKRLMIMAGGTGGHIFPGLTVAKYLKIYGWDVCWLGTANRMEADLVPKHGINIKFIKISSLRGKGFFAFFLAFFEIIQAIKKAKFIIKNYQPDIVLGMGGYISFPGVVAAWLSNIPIVLHEQNAVAGLTNRFLAKIAKCILQAFPGAFSNAMVVGNPIREDILRLPDPEKRFINRNNVIQVLVIGGSQGANIFNQIIPQLAVKLNKKIIIFHQTGKNNEEITKSLYKKICDTTIIYKVTEFIDDMAEAYAWADIVICRSGALTVSEISVIGLAAIFVPFQHKDRQQYWNAATLEKIKAAKIIEQPYFSTDVLLKLFNKWNRVDLLEMSKKARTISITDSTQRIAATLIDIVK
ncbi:undecaprenyldiphospho-muramoylpentapeptide beta-N-acetylglucosaminyltransferase [Arsenophonus symbiont of Ornithomya chloropus]|uniref:undecaprenyldiphospho-muramoylpentapeptide beta-N-acetylglucosaminyltransferase n=1 Tax=Arsenophonus symbiont of Ornithomya chloropus TaxID=634121 RepID=UPI0032B1A1BE